MARTVEVTLSFDDDTKSVIENVYLSMVTSMGMLRAFAMNTARFRGNYEETFASAEANYSEDTGATKAEAIEWTEEQLGIYFANLQNTLFQVLKQLEKSEHIDPRAVEIGQNVDGNVLVQIDGFDHSNFTTEIPEIMKLEILKMLDNAENN